LIGSEVDAPENKPGVFLRSLRMCRHNVTSYFKKTASRKRPAERFVEDAGHRAELFSYSQTLFPARLNVQENKKITRECQEVFSNKAEAGKI